MEPSGTRQERPHASWVMGRSARWHDPEFLQSLEEPSGAAQDVALLRTALSASAGTPSPLVLVRLLVETARLLLRLRRVHAR